MKFENRVFRLRDPEKIFGNIEKEIDPELENGYFYFSDKEQLNDPMEGHINLYWEGDYVAWMGLFKNYVWQLFYTIYYYLPLGASLAELERLFLTRSEAGLKGTKVIEHRRIVENSFASNEKIKIIATTLEESKSKIGYEELSIVLLWVHTDALTCVYDTLKEVGNEEFFRWLDDAKNISFNNISDISFSELLSDQVKFKSMSYAVKNTMNQMTLIMGKKRSDEDLERFKIHKFIFLEFANNYANKLQRLALSDGYCVSFTTKINNPALWGYYTDNHKGIALIFDYHESESIDLYQYKNEDRKVGEKAELLRVLYEPNESINFFMTLGHLFGDERQHWLTHENRKSVFLEEYKKIDYGKWYYQKLTERFLKKDKTWKDEDELRIVLNDDWEYHGTPEKRSYKYDFSRLKGIVFGMRTTYDDKIRIIDILQKKCRENNVNEFEVYEATFNSESNEMEFDRMRMVEESILKKEG